MSILTLTTMICVVLININGSHTVPICCTKPLPELVEVHEKYECFDIKLQVKMPCPEREPMKDPDSEVFNANAKPERSEKILGSFQNENPVKNTSEFISLASWLPSFR